jgi:hypothetical protein
MAASLPRARPQPFAQHIRRLCWFALVAGVVITARAIQPAGQTAPAITLLAVVVFLAAIWTIATHVGGYARREQARQRQAVETAWRAGACQAATTIQDRLANRLSLALGYAEFLVEDGRLPDDAREQARKVMDGAMAAAQIVSAVRTEFGCASDDALAQTDPASLVE